MFFTYAVSIHKLDMRLLVQLEYGKRVGGPFLITELNRRNFAAVVSLVLIGRRVEIDTA